MFISYPEIIDSDDPNKPKPKQYDRHSTDDIFKCISMNENLWIVKKISMKYFVLSGLIDNMAALGQRVAWRRTDNKPLSDAMCVCCTDASMCHTALVSQLIGAE